MAVTRNKKAELKSSLDKSIVLNFQQIITYSAFLITFGASIYTFFKAIPKLDALDKEIITIDKNVAVFEVKISDLNDYLKSSRSKDANPAK